MQKKQLVTGLSKFQYSDIGHVCDACQFGKQSRLPFVRHVRQSTRPLQLVHSNVWGPTHNASMGGSKYYVTFIDDYSRYTWVYILKTKDEVFAIFQQFKKQVEKEFDCYISCLRSDSGGEYVSNEFDNFQVENGIRRQLTCSYTPNSMDLIMRKHSSLLPRWKPYAL